MSKVWGLANTLAQCSFHTAVLLRKSRVVKFSCQGSAACFSPELTSLPSPCAELPFVDDGWSFLMLLPPPFFWAPPPPQAGIGCAVLRSYGIMWNRECMQQCTGRLGFREHQRCREGFVSHTYINTCCIPVR